MFNYIIQKLLYKSTSNISLRYLDYLLPKDVLAKINAMGGGR